MYDSEYFRKVIGDNYNPNDLYSNTTYNNSTDAKIYEVNSKVAFDNSPNLNNEQIIANNPNINSTPTVTNITPNTNPVSSQPVNNISSYETYNVNANPESQIAYNVNIEPAPQIAYNVNTNPTSEIHYPDIYNVLNPMIDKVLETNKNIEYNEATINAMSTEIYNALETDSNPQKTTNVASPFNNVIQVNAKPKNYLLHDLIKIMLIGKIKK